MSSFLHQIKDILFHLIWSNQKRLDINKINLSNIVSINKISFFLFVPDSVIFFEHVLALSINILLSQSLPRTRTCSKRNLIFPTCEGFLGTRERDKVCRRNMEAELEIMTNVLKHSKRRAGSKRDNNNNTPPIPQL